jgi:hypothetical protein
MHKPFPIVAPVGTIYPITRIDHIPSVVSALPPFPYAIRILDTPQQYRLMGEDTTVRYQVWALSYQYYTTLP